MLPAIAAMSPMLKLGLGVGGSLLGGYLTSRQKTAGIPDGMSTFMKDLKSPDISQFRDIARQAAPSQQDLMRLAAATGGSQASATAQAMGGQTRAMDAALRAFQQQEQANQGLLANLYSQQYGYMQQDRAFRRQTGVDIFSNLASLGSGLLGQQYGMEQFKNNFGQQGINFKDIVDFGFSIG